ncbi:MAG: discoidin domain-containing protein [Paucibacter sp.]|nr:discoidin domain-containing protein [Roseateles sp.]
MKSIFRISFARIALAQLMLVSLLAQSPAVLAQEIVIDTAAAHRLNAFKPTEALGAAMDRLPPGSADKLLAHPVVDRMLEAGWQPITYRQNTELHAEAWHWNPQGSWSEPGLQGYFTGAATPTGAPIRHSYGYPLPRRGVTRDDGTDNIGYSRLTDGDPSTFWKSNPYLSRAFTGEDDVKLPQWVVLDLSVKQPVSTVRIQWAQPFAKRYVVQYWVGGDDPMRKPTGGVWKAFPFGQVDAGAGGTETRRLAPEPIEAQWLRISMSESSNTCDKADAGDPRNCVGYAIREVSLGTQSADGSFHDLVRHTPDQDQTATYCSSIDPWHRAADLDEKAGDQVGFDLFFRSGLTRGLPAMVPIAMLYNTPEDAVNELRYLKARGYPISYVEMGEEADGHYTTPEDYAALYMQFATALHRFDPELKLGGPVFTGQNEDIETWPNAQGDASWTHRFVEALRRHGRLNELSFFSFEHYPVDPGKMSWASLYEEPRWVQHILDIWTQDGVPADVPRFITESNLSAVASEAYMDIWSGLWLADYAGAFFSGGGSALYYFHIMPEPFSPGVHGSPGSFGLLAADKDWRIGQPLAQFFASQLINQEWVVPGSHDVHQLFPARSGVQDEAGHTLVTAYPLLRPDGQWSLMLINKDQDNAVPVRLRFVDAAGQREQHFVGPVRQSAFGRAQYQWHPSADQGGHADPDGPVVHNSLDAKGAESITLPAASIVVLTGRLQ